tara:strand:- start:395 stop:619 length:225 start_codon:yes stop_codon:yes gene_type:complete
LYFHKLSDYVLKKAFQEIDEEEYINTLHELMLKKAALIKDKNPFIRNKKLAQWLISKGYESSLVWEVIKEANKS